jgi:hypothetical protein
MRQRVVALALIIGLVAMSGLSVVMAWLSE